MSELVRHDEPVVADESPPGGPDSLLAVRSEGNVCDAGMLPTQGPLGLTMTGNEDAWGRHDRTVRVGVPCDRARA